MTSKVPYTPLYDVELSQNYFSEQKEEIRCQFSYVYTKLDLFITKAALRHTISACVYCMGLSF